MEQNIVRTYVSIKYIALGKDKIKGKQLCHILIILLLNDAIMIFSFAYSWFTTIFIEN